VSDLKGVETVVNEIEVAPLSPNDNRLRRAAYRALFNGDSPLFLYGLSPVPSIHLVIKNGRCTFKELVTTKADSDYANIKARGVSGLFEVVNELQIEKTSRE
jgi:hyperosmotically inducible periplasmic protein